jgi:hypothetical protein
LAGRAKTKGAEARGDESAPVHELGIELHNALIENDLDVRGGKCVGRLALIKCLLRGDLLIEGASLGTLVLRGSRLGGIKGNGRLGRPNDQPQVRQR